MKKLKKLIEHYEVNIGRLIGEKVKIHVMDGQGNTDIDYECDGIIKVRGQIDSPRRTWVFSSEIQAFPGNPEIAVSIHSIVYEDYRGKGVGTWANNLRQEIARLFDIKMLMCTVRRDNSAQIRLMDRTGWSQISSTEEVFVYTKRLDIKPEDIG